MNMGSSSSAPMVSQGVSTLVFLHTRQIILKSRSALEWVRYANRGHQGITCNYPIFGQLSVSAMFDKKRTHSRAWHDGRFTAKEKYASGQSRACRTG